MRSTLPPAVKAEVLLLRLGAIHASMAETTSNPDVLTAASCGLKPVRLDVRFCMDG